MERKIVIEYDGFESCQELERDISEIWFRKEFKDIPPEFEGTLKITVEYIENK